MAKLVTRATELMQAPPKTEEIKIQDNTNPDGGILCIDCEVGYLTKETRDVKISAGFTEAKIVPLCTYFCDVCDFMSIQKQEVFEIREYLQKDLA
jgi:hypothetical protein